MATEQERIVRQFQVTKLRSWRTGYLRLLVLYENEFITLDPDSRKETNRWPYSSLLEWMALPKENEAILLQVGDDKLKFLRHAISRSAVLIALLQQRGRPGQASGKRPR